MNLFHGFIKLSTVLLCASISAGCINSPAGKKVVSGVIEYRSDEIAENKDLASEPKNSVSTSEIIAQAELAFQLRPEPLKLPPTKRSIEFSAEESLKVWATHYYIQYAKDGGNVPLIDTKDRPLGPQLSQRDWCYAAREGTVRVGSKLYNYAGRSAKSQVDCSKYVNLPRNILNRVERVQFIQTDAPYGLGVKKWQLVPYRTVAVDPKQIPFGTVLYIPDVAGTFIKQDNGELWQHDGYFFAGDTGSAIKNTQIDVFLGTSRENPFEALLSSNRERTLSAYRVNDPDKIRRLTAAHEGFINLAKLQ